MKKLDLGYYDCGLITSALITYKPLNDFDQPRIDALCDMFNELTLTYELRDKLNSSEKDKKKKKKKKKKN